MNSNLTKVAAYLMVVLMAFCGNARAANDIIIGRTLSLEGPTQSYGQAKLDGSDAYIAKVNAAGGINGRKIHVVTLNDSYTPAVAVANLKKMASENQPLAFLGVFGVPVVAAVLPVIDELKIPTVGLTSGVAELRNPGYRYSFPVRADYGTESEKLVTHVKTIGVSKLGLIYSDNPFGSAVRGVLEAEMKNQKYTPVVVKVAADGKDADVAAKSVFDGKPEAVFLGMLTQAAVPVVTSLRKSGFKGTIYALSPVDGTQMVKQLQSGAANLAISQVVPVPDSVRTLVAGEYMQALKSLGRGEPSFYGLEGFIEAKLLVEGIKRAGPKVTTESLQKSLETFEKFDLGGFMVSYKPQSHKGSSFSEVNAINSRGQIAR